MEKCRFLLFSDLHILPEAFFDPTGGHKLDAIIQAARDNQVDFVIHAGDFSHGTDAVPEGAAALERYNSLEIPTYHTLGNHDTDKTCLEDTLKNYRMPGEYYFFDCNGIRMIVLNSNYCCIDGEWVPYSLGNYRNHGGSTGHMPQHEIEWLAQTIETSKHPCVIISHQSIERDADGMTNAAEVRAVINAANTRRKGAVIMCINGHYHTNNIRIRDGVCYLDMNSAAYYWVDKKHDAFPAEMNEKYSCMRNSLIYNDALYAIVTVTDDNMIEIKGMESDFYMGVSWEKVSEHPFDRSGRQATASVESASFRLL